MRRLKCAYNAMRKPWPPLGEWSTSLRHITRMERTGMVVLLILLVLAVFGVPVILPPGVAEQLVADILVTLILLSGIVAVVEYRRTAIALAVLAFIAIALRWSEWFVSVGLLSGLQAASTLGALLILAFAVGITVFVSNRAVSARIVGAVVLYLLIGLLWAYMYYGLETLRPDAFAGAADSEKGFARWVYFSFVTLTTVGYGDITPVARATRSLAILEALIGQLYPAIILGRLLSLPIGERSSPDRPPSASGSP
jgi:hypothetical protein